MQPFPPFKGAGGDFPLKIKAPAPADRSDRGLRIRPPEVVSFDAFLNTFYESYWTRHTDLDAVALEVSGEGPCWCAVRREVGGGSGLAAHAVFDLRPGEPRHLEVALAHGDGSRLFVEVGGVGRPFRLDGLSWAAARPPAREVTVGVAICTFNREDYLACTVERLARTPAVAQLVVVNHGDALADRRLAQIAAARPGWMTVVDQPNCGGAGGFARGALEVMADGGVSHVLFMDDDVDVEPAHVVTAAAFAAHARKPLVVGGQMLDLYKRCLMFEAGACVTATNLLEANHRDLPLERPQALAQLAARARSDFNGWWFSLIPLQAFRDHGLPMPIFIRGDDQEFGVRLARAGVETVSLPPVSVWHEPFNAKPPGWPLYYDLRNRLIFASLYPDAYRLDGAAQLLKRLLSMLIRFDYAQARSIRLALRDYLAGPAGLETSAAEHHARVTAELAAVAAQRVPRPTGAPMADDTHPLDKPRGRRRLLASLLRLLFARPERNPAGETCLMYARMPLDLMRLGRSYVLSDDGDHFFLRFRHSRRESWRALVATSWVIAGYALRRRKLADRWRSAACELTSFASWGARLGLDPERVRAAQDGAV